MRLQECCRTCRFDRLARLLNSEHYHVLMLLCCRCDAGTNNFITVMSYGCDQVNNAAARTAELFSNPNLRVNTLPAGDANTAHCGRTLQEHRTRIAAARTGVAPPPPSGSTITSGLSTSKCLDVPNLNQIGTQVRGCLPAACAMITYAP